MKKPMLGIIGICLLQIAFVAYNAYELPFDLSAVTPVREMPQAPPDFDPVEDNIVVFRSVIKARPKMATPAPALVAVKREKRTVTKNDPIRPWVTLAVQRKPARTEYPTSPIENRERQNAVAASIVTREPKKKSFFAKALPIIKKPYDWAKAFAGKLK